MKCINYFDILSKEPNLYVNKYSSFSNIFTLILSVISLIIVLIPTVIFTLNFFNGKNINVITNQTRKIRRFTDLHSNLLMFRFNSVYGKIYNETMTNFVFQKWTFLPKNNGIPNITKIDIEKCNRTKHISKDYEEFYTETPVEQFYCVSNPNVNLSIYGRAQDTQENSYIMIYIAKCLDKSPYHDSNIKCENETQIINQIGALPHFITLAYLDNQIDHDDVKKPASYYLKTFTLPVGLSINFRHLISLKNVEYSSDSGIIFDEITQMSFVQFDRITPEAYINPFTVPGSFGAVTLTLSEIGDVHIRKYEKIQNLAANIGGIMKGVLFLASLLAEFFSHNLYLEYLNKSMSNKFDNSYFKISEPNIVALDKTTNLYTLKRINLKMPEIILPNFCLKKRKVNRLLYYFNEFIKEKLSIENILTNCINFENIEKLVINNINHNTSLENNNLNSSSLEISQKKKANLQNLNKTRIKEKNNQINNYIIREKI